MQRIAVEVARAVEQVLSIWLVTSTTSVSPSHFPTEWPIQESFGYGST